MENNAPQGFVLVNETEYKQLKENLKSIERAVNIGRRSDVNADITRIIKETASRANNKGSRSSTPHRQEDLVKLMEKKCNDSRDSSLRSKLETTKSNCTKKLKKAVEDQQKKQKDAKKTLKNRFEQGQEQTKELYNTELMNSFQNQNALNSSLPVDQYACEELVKTYQDTMRTLLLPEMNNMYKTHCNKLDNALKEWIADYTSNQIMPETQSRTSAAVQHRLQEIQAQIERLTNKERDVVEDTVRSLETTLEKVTQPLNSFTVDLAPRELTIEEKIDQAMETLDYNGALHQALLALDVATLLATCHRIPVVALFSDPFPDQSILLSLLNQLQGNISEDMELKCTFLQETIRAIEHDSPTIEANREQTLRELYRLIDHIDETNLTVGPVLFQKHLKYLRWDANMVVQQISSTYGGL